MVTIGNSVLFFGIAHQRGVLVKYPPMATNPTSPWCSWTLVKVTDGINMAPSSNRTRSPGSQPGNVDSSSAGVTTKLACELYASVAQSAEALVSKTRQCGSESHPKYHMDGQLKRSERVAEAHEDGGSTPLPPTNRHIQQFTYDSVISPMVGRQNLQSGIEGSSPSLYINVPSIYRLGVMAA